MLRLVRGVVKAWAAGLLLAVRLWHRLWHGLPTVPRIRPKVSRRRIALAALLALVFCTAAPPAYAEPIFFGPTPYLSAADSPFDLSGLGTTFFLEDFEDGELNTPGILISGLSVLQPNFDRDSVDGDDSVIDGFGIEGHSARGGGICTDTDPPSCWWTASVIFDADQLGWLPTAVGIVWTDGSPMDGLDFRILIDLVGQSVGSGQRYFLGDDNRLGGTAEDRFFGVVDPDGILGIILLAGKASTAESGDPFEVDHLQYGLFIPEPGADAMMLIGLVGLSLSVARIW